MPRSTLWTDSEVSDYMNAVMYEGLSTPGEVYEKYKNKWNNKFSLKQVQNKHSYIKSKIADLANNAVKVGKPKSVGGIPKPISATTLANFLSPSPAIKRKEMGFLLNCNKNPYLEEEEEEEELEPIVKKRKTFHPNGEKMYWIVESKKHYAIIVITNALVSRKIRKTESKFRVLLVSLSNPPENDVLNEFSGEIQLNTFIKQMEPIQTEVEINFENPIQLSNWITKRSNGYVIIEIPKEEQVVMNDIAL